MDDADDALCKVTDARFRSELEKVRSVILEEERIRAAIRALDTPVADANPALPAMRAIGADLAWTRWQGKQRSALNMQLAGVLVRKQAMLKQVRLAFGRNEAAKALRKKAQQEERRRDAAQADQALLALMLNVAGLEG